MSGFFPWKSFTGNRFLITLHFWFLFSQNLMGHSPISYHYRKWPILRNLPLNETIWRHWRFAFIGHYFRPLKVYCFLPLYLFTLFQYLIFKSAHIKNKALNFAFYMPEKKCFWGRPSSSIAAIYSHFILHIIMFLCGHANKYKICKYRCTLGPKVLVPQFICIIFQLNAQKRLKNKSVNWYQGWSTMNCLGFKTKYIVTF